MGRVQPVLSSRLQHQCRSDAVPSASRRQVTSTRLPASAGPDQATAHEAEMHGPPPACRQDARSDLGVEQRTAHPGRTPAGFVGRLNAWPYEGFPGCRGLLSGRRKDPARKENNLGHCVSCTKESAYLAVPTRKGWPTPVSRAGRQDGLGRHSPFQAPIHFVGTKKPNAGSKKSPYTDENGSGVLTRPEVSGYRIRWVR